jgi:sugar lactone lactonase YvrE
MTMSNARFLRVLLGVLAAAIAGSPVTGSGLSLTPHAQGTPQAPTNSAPNPYETIEGWAKMPAGRTWGATSAVEIDKDGASIWVAERCGANRCVNQQTGEVSPVDVVLKFDASGTLVKSFGAGLFVFPHGMHIDRDGNIWVTDGQDNFPSRGRNAAPDTPLPPPPAKPMGHQIFKFSPDGKLLMTLGKAGGNRPGEPADPASFYQPNDVITNAAGEIFVCEGHSSGAGATARVSKFDKTGTFIKSFGGFGAAAGEFNQPHSFAWDSKGRLFVADRSNNRIQIFDQNGTLLESGWQQYSRISGLWIDRNDVLYAADSESGSVAPDRKDWTRGVRIGNVRDGKDGKVQFFIPDPAQNATNTSSAEGIAVDAAGHIFGAEVGQRALKKYIKR